MRSTLTYALKRLLLVPFMLFLIATLSFLLLALIPGDPAVLIVGEFADQETLARVRADLGLDRPFWEQYLTYLAAVAQADLGQSYLTGTPVMEEIGQRLPNSLVIIIPSLLMAVVVGTVVGTAGGYFRRGPVGKVTSVLISAAQGVPPFFLAIVLIYLLVFTIRMFPVPTGMLYSSMRPPPEVTGVVPLDALLAGQWSVLGAITAHAILPVIATGLFLASYFAKTVRTSVTQAMATPQVEFARACGLPERQVVRYALLTARTSVLTYTAVLFGVMLSATAVVEVVFSWPGIGAWALDGVLKGDLPIIQGFIVVTGGLVIIAYVVLDVLVAALDPRIRH
ncbi:ABC transporter permease [Rhizohabitans arisaemae]|uniref:ABC transporter permease n=1 Tax=Rhizohabitans arisaemae TaxID=2720610 RepID=UPI0024B044E3|nr:ABC transporter permease [Rhizohabitans arisaemae]